MRLKRKLLSVIMTAAMITTLFAGLTITASAYTATGTMTSLKTSTGYNDAANETYYSISSDTEMGYFKDYVNGGHKTSGVTFYLTTGVTLPDDWAGIGTATAQNNGYGTSSVTSDSIPFNGTFDGQNKTITLSGSGNGIFNYVGSKGEVKNFTVAQASTATNGGVYSTTSGDYAATVAAFNRGIIHNITNNAVVNASNKYNVGGIVGFNDGYNEAGTTAVYNCKNTAAVTGNTKVGGIAGENAGLIAVCTNTGTIQGSNTGNKNGVGGIAGRNGNNNTARETGIITSCVNGGEVGSSGQKWVGGITGFQNELSRVSDSVSYGAIYGGSYSNAIIGKNESSYTGTTNYSLSGSDHGTGSGSALENGIVLTENQMKNVDAVDGTNYLFALLNSYRETAIVTENPWPATTVTGVYPYLTNVVVKPVTNTTISSSVAAVSVHVNGSTGVDTNTGADSDHAVKTLAKAAELVAAGGTGSKIYIDSMVTVASDLEIFQDIDIIWNGTENGTMIKLTDGTLTLGNVDIVGLSEADPPVAAARAIWITGGTLNIRNNSSISGATTAIDYDGGYVYFSRSSITGTVQLAQGKFIVIQSILTSNLTVNCDSPSNDTIVAQADSTEIAAGSLAYLTYGGSTYHIDLLTDDSTYMVLVS